jgi:hypothetical protein
MRPAGWGTENDVGRCKFHGGATPVKSGRYSTVKRKRIAELLKEFRADPDPLDITEELHLLRALVLDYVERYDEVTDLLSAWHSSFGPAFQDALRIWRDEYGDWREKMTDIYEDGWQDVEVKDLPEPPVLPDPLEHQNKPRQVIDILQVGNFVDKITRIVERSEKMKQEGAVSLKTLDQYLTRLGEEVVATAREVIPNDVQRAQLLDTLEAKWRVIPLRDPSSGTGATQGARELN